VLRFRDAASSNGSRIRGDMRGRSASTTGTGAAMQMRTTDTGRVYAPNSAAVLTSRKPMCDRSHSIAPFMRECGALRASGHDAQNVGVGTPRPKAIAVRAHRERSAPAARDRAAGCVTMSRPSPWIACPPCPHALPNSISSRASALASQDART
jgi:hypothetical protein